MVGEPPRGEDDDAFNGEGGVDGSAASDDQSTDDEVGGGLGSSGTMSSGPSLCSSWSSLVTEDHDDDDDGDTTADSSTAVVGDHASAFFSSSSSSSDYTVHPDGDGAGDGAGDGGPLYELLPLLEHLPVRTGLSRYYQGKSQSFTSLSDAKCLQDLAKKNTPPYGGFRIRAARRGAAASRSSSAISRRAPGLCSKTIAKKTAAPIRGSSDRQMSRARSACILHSSGGGGGKPPAYHQSKKELSRNMFF